MFIWCAEKSPPEKCPTVKRCTTIWHMWKKSPIPYFQTVGKSHNTLDYLDASKLKHSALSQLSTMCIISKLLSFLLLMIQITSLLFNKTNILKTLFQNTSMLLLNNYILPINKQVNESQYSEMNKIISFSYHLLLNHLSVY